MVLFWDVGISISGLDLMHLHLDLMDLVSDPYMTLTSKLVTLHECEKTKALPTWILNLCTAHLLSDKHRWSECWCAAVIFIWYFYLIMIVLSFDFHTCYLLFEQSMLIYILWQLLVGMHSLNVVFLLGDTALNCLVSCPKKGSPCTIQKRKEKKGSLCHWFFSRL